MYINLKIGHVPIRGTARRQREKRVNRAHTERPAVPVVCPFYVRRTPFLMITNQIFC